MNVLAGDGVDTWNKLGSQPEILILWISGLDPVDFYGIQNPVVRMQEEKNGPGPIFL